MALVWAQSLNAVAQLVTGFNLRPISRSTTVVKGKPFRSEFSETIHSGGQRIVVARGLFLRDNRGSTRTDFFDGSGERSKMQAIDLRNENTLHLLYPNIKAGMKVITHYKNEEPLQWLYEGTALIEAGAEMVGGLGCKRFRVANSSDNVKTDVCISELLQAVIQERTQEGGGIYTWELSNVRSGELPEVLFVPPDDFRVLPVPQD